LSPGDVDAWTTSVRRRGRCADRQTSNRVVGPSFVSSARVQLGGGFEAKQQMQQQPQQQQQHSEQSPSSSNSVDVSTAQPNNNAASTTTGNCVQTANQHSAGSRPPEPPWIGYDNIAELKEAIHSSAAAKMAAGLKTKGGPATTTPVLPGGGLSGGTSSERVPPRVIGERLVDVHRQRLSAAGRELTSAGSASRTEAAAGLIITSPGSEVTRTGAVEAEQPRHRRTNSAASSSDAGSLCTAQIDIHLTNGDLKQNKKTVSFEKEFANSDETKAAADKGRKRKTKDKPPSGATGNDSSNKKVEKKSERRNDSKEQKPTTGSETATEERDGKTAKPANKISFLKSLLTRSRSPSPKRGARVNGSSNSGSDCPVSVGRDVAKRLSDPLKASFKQTPDVPVVKVTVKRNEKKKKQPAADDAKNDSRQTSDPKVSSDCKEEVSMTNSSDERLEEPSTSASAEKLKPSATPTPEGRSESSELSRSAATSSTSCNVEQREVKSTSHGSVPCPSTESAAVVTAASAPPASENATVARSSSDVLEQSSSERRQSATIITLRSATSGSGESATNRLLQDQTVSGTAAEPRNPWLDQHQTANGTAAESRNPWLVNIRDFQLRPKLDRFEGEKVCVLRCIILSVLRCIHLCIFCILCTVFVYLL